MKWRLSHYQVNGFWWKSFIWWVEGRRWWWGEWWRSWRWEHWVAGRHRVVIILHKIIQLVSGKIASLWQLNLLIFLQEHISSSSRKAQNNQQWLSTILLSYFAKNSHRPNALIKMSIKAASFIHLSTEPYKVNIFQRGSYMCPAFKVGKMCH